MLLKKIFDKGAMLEDLEKVENLTNREVTGD
jgi:hypothetical protein